MGFKSPFIDDIDGVVSHEFHGWVRPGGSVPRALVDKAWFGRERHESDGEFRNASDDEGR